MFKVGDKVRVRAIPPLDEALHKYQNLIGRVLNTSSKYVAVKFSPSPARHSRTILFLYFEILPWPPTDFMEYMKVMLLKGGQNGQT